MKKKFVSALLVCAMMFAMAMPGFAASPKDVARIEREVDCANAQIYTLVRFAQWTPRNDVPWLLKKVDRIAGRVIMKAQRVGVTVVCEYEEYIIDGQVVLIDPLMVVN